MLLELGRRLVVQGAVQPLAIIKRFDVIKEGQIDLCMREPMPAVNQLCFERAEERFHAGVIVAVARSAHAGEHPMSLEQAAIFMTGILRAAIRMMQQACRRTPMGERPVQGLLNQRGFEMVSGGPADDLAAAKVHHGRQIKPALGGGNVSDVAHPDLIRFGGRRAFFEPVGRNRKPMIAVSGARAKSSAL